MKSQAKTNTLPTKTLNAVVIGVGGQGSRRSKSIQFSRGWKLVGLYDDNHDLARRAARKWNCHCFTDPIEAINSDQTHIVCIATPPSSHDDFILKAVQANRHVLCEKPLTIRPEMIRDHLLEAEEKELLIATGFNHRFYSPVLDAMQLISQNAIGAITEINGRIGQRPDHTLLNGWMGNYLLSGGGVLVDNGSHLIDLACLFLDGNISTEVIDYRSLKDRIGIDEHVVLQLKDSQGLKANLKASWIEPEAPYLSMELKGESGMIRLSAFPWRLEIEKPGQRTEIKSYLTDRIAMKCLGFLASGLETSLMREMKSIRHSILKIKEQGIKHSTGIEGLIIAEIIENIKKTKANKNFNNTSLTNANLKIA